MSEMFRQKALIKLKSPEQLDEPLAISQRRHSWAGIALLLLLLVACTWGVFGQVPTVGVGQAILITPNTVAQIQAPAEGQVARWRIVVGSVVEKGEVIGTLYQPAIERDLAQAEAKLGEMAERDRCLKEIRDRASAIAHKGTERRQAILLARIQTLEGHIGKAKRISADVKAKNDDFLRGQRKNLSESRDALQEVSKLMKQRSESYGRLLSEKLTSQDTVLAIQSRYDDSVLRLLDLDLQIKDLDMKAVQARQTDLDAADQIATQEGNLTQTLIQLRELENKEAQQKKQDSEADFKDKSEEAELRLNIERQKQRLEINRQIRSEYAGRILELTVAEGSVVTSGQRLAQIDTRADTDELIALAYFQDTVGKQLAPGTAVRVSPSTVPQREYGNIKGEVMSVAPFPVTADAIANYVGNPAIAQQLTQGGFLTEVRVRLQTDPNTPSGYAWTSERGPEAKISAGTSASLAVTYEHRAPAAYLFPSLGRWSWR